MFAAGAPAEGQPITALWLSRDEG